MDEKHEVEQVRISRCLQEKPEKTQRYLVLISIYIVTILYMYLYSIPFLVSFLTAKSSESEKNSLVDHESRSKVTAIHVKNSPTRKETRKCFLKTKTESPNNMLKFKGRGNGKKVCFKNILIQKYSSQTNFYKVVTK